MSGTQRPNDRLRLPENLSASGEARLPLPAGPRAVPEARRLVRDACLLWGLPGARDDAELLASEVVTNAVVHAGGPSLLVLVRAVRHGVRVEVHDRDPQGLRRRRLSTGGTGGRGLHLIARLARAWGVERMGAGKAVWFEVGGDRNASGGPPLSG